MFRRSNKCRRTSCTYEYVRIISHVPSRFASDGAFCRTTFRRADAPAPPLPPPSAPPPAGSGGNKNKEQHPKEDRPSPPLYQHREMLQYTSAARRRHVTLCISQEGQDGERYVGHKRPRRPRAKAGNERFNYLERYDGYRHVRRRRLGSVDHHGVVHLETGGAERSEGRGTETRGGGGGEGGTDTLFFEHG